MSVRNLKSSTLLKNEEHRVGNNPIPPDLYTYQTVSGTGFSRSGDYRQNWRDLIKSGGNATNNFSATDLRLTSMKPIRATWKTKPSFGTRVTSCVNEIELRQFYTYANIPGDLLSTIDNKARAKVYRRMQSFNATTAFGELRETLRMLVRPAHALREGLDRYRRTALKHRAREKTRANFLKAVSGSWLEYSFGWKPLMHDIKDAAEAFAKSSSDPIYQHFSVTENQTYTRPKVLVYNGGIAEGGAISARVYAQARMDCSVRYCGSATVKTSVPNAHAARFGTGMPSFVPAAWELMPYSFLIDYFTNIGDCLDAWAIAQYTTFRWTCRTTRVFCRSQTWSELYNGNAIGDLTYTDNGSATWESLSLSRSNIGSIPLPFIQIQDKLGLKQSLNIAALVANRRADSQFRKRS